MFQHTLGDPELGHFMPSVPLHLAVSRESRYLNFNPCVLLMSACMPAVVIATGWAVSALTRLITRQ